MKYLQEFLNPVASIQSSEPEVTAKNLQNLQKSDVCTQNTAFIGSIGFSPDEQSAPPNLSSLPPALRERPGMNFVAPGLWIWRGFIILTPATMPAYKKHYAKQAKLRRQREQDVALDEPP